MKKGDDDGAAERAAYVDAALEKCRRACRRGAVVPVAVLAVRPLRTNDRAGGLWLQVMTLDGGLVNPADVFRHLREQLDDIIKELEGDGGGPAHGGY